MKQSAKPWLQELFLPTINHMFGSPARRAEHRSSSPSGFYPHKQLQSTDHLPPERCFFFSLFRSALPLSASQLLRLPRLKNSLPFITCKENFTWRQRAIRKAQLYRKHTRGPLPGLLAPRGPYPSSLLLRADTWLRMLKIGTFLPDPGVAVLPSLTPCSALPTTTHTHTHTHTPKFASAFSSHDISLTQKTHRLQITKSRKGLCSSLCPQGFNPKCVFFFLSSFPRGA